MRNRYLSEPVQLRHEESDDGESHPKIAGYAAVFYREEDEGTEYRIGKHFVERIMPGAFDRALDENDNVRGLFNHDANMILGNTESGTMSLSTDERGLMYVIDPPSTRADVVETVRRKDVIGSSFAFNILEETRIDDEENDRVIYEIHNVRLFDVGPVVFPAYESATSEIRSDPRFQVDRKKRMTNVAEEFVYRQRAMQMGRA